MYSSITVNISLLHTVYSSLSQLCLSSYISYCTCLKLKAFNWQLAKHSQEEQSAWYRGNRWVYLQKATQSDYCARVLSGTLLSTCVSYKSRSIEPLLMTLQKNKSLDNLLNCTLKQVQFVWLCF